jgi:hypothetical protein
MRSLTGVGPRDRGRLRFAAATMLAWALIVAAEPGMATETGPVVAVFPVENLSGRLAPLEDVRRLVIARLSVHGLRVLDEVSQERVLVRHRIRYTAGVDQQVARAFRDAGVEGIVIPSLEQYDAGSVPRIGLFLRLVSTGDAPTVRWVDGRGAAGDDAPGILGIGLIDDPGTLLARAVESLAVSLGRAVSDPGSRVGDRRGASKFQPKLVYRSEALDAARTYSVAVVPFFNKSERKLAGEIIALHMMRDLMTFPGLNIVEPGVVRQELLRFRIVMSEGVSLPETETILNAVNADLVLNGEVLEYEDARGTDGAPTVDFGVLFIERRTRRVVYSSYSENRGDDGVFFFDVGRVNTAHEMASQMVRAIGGRMMSLPGRALPAVPERCPRAGERWRDGTGISGGGTCESDGR